MSLLDFREYLIEQSLERYPAFIIHAAAISRKTWFAERVQERFNKEYRVRLIDLQVEFFSKVEELWTHGAMSPTELKSYLLNLAFDERIVIIDNPDFLINTWTEDQKVQFIRIIEDGISVDYTDKIFIFMIQTDPTIVGKKIKNSRFNPRVLHLSAFAEF